MKTTYGENKLHKQVELAIGKTISSIVNEMADEAANKAREKVINECGQIANSIYKLEEIQVMEQKLIINIEFK